MRQFHIIALLLMGMSIVLCNVTRVEVTPALHKELYLQVEYALATVVPQFSGLPLLCVLCKQTNLANAPRVVSTFSHLIPSATGYLARDDTKKHLILAFRGTTTPLDMLNNVILLDAEYPGPSAAPGSKVHLGWLESYRSVTDQFMPNLVRLMEGECKGYKLVITGQSMGAAHAILAAVDIHLKHPNWSLEAHPSAQPRVGNEQWAKFVSALPFPIYRLTAYDDPVPHLPPSAMGFKHHRGEVYISSDSAEFVGCETVDGIGEDPKCIQGRPFNPLTVTDHVTGYLGFLKE